MKTSLVKSLAYANQQRQCFIKSTPLGLMDMYVGTYVHNKYTVLFTSILSDSSVGIFRNYVFVQCNLKYPLRQHMI